MTKVLLIAPARGPAETAGPALRYRQLADELRRSGAEATLATPGAGADADWSRIRPFELARGHTAVICPQGLADEAGDLARRLPPDFAFIVDCYAPALVERALLLPDDVRFADFRRLVLGALERADLLLVANEPQRAYVLGLLSALGRMTPEREPPPVLLAPMGAPSPRPSAVEPVAGLVLWFGGLWPWFDGVSAVEAFALVGRQNPAASLQIVGGRHPSGGAPDTLDDVMAVAASLGVAGRVESLPWVARGELPDLLGRASCALCLAHEGLEHRLAQRTRILDLLSAGVPIVCTRGDALGMRAVEAGAATAVPAGDSAAAAQAVGRLLGDSEARHACSDAARRLASELAPQRTLAEAVAWLRAPIVSKPARRVEPRWRRLNR